jgi:SAM-dependent methyltransferase
MPGFLEIARKDASERGVQVAYLEGDMRKLDYNAAFDRVLLLFTAFGYFEDDENFQVLKNVARALKPGGLFVFDTQSRDAILKELHPSHVTEKDGNLMIDRITFDPLSGRLYNHRIVIRDGVRRDKPFFIRMYSPTEVRDLLQRVGLEVFRIYGGWGDDSGAPSLTSESRRMVVIAQKPG